MKVATSVATYGPGSANRGRSSGRAMHATRTPSGRRTPGYLEQNARPSATPAIAHHRRDSRERGGSESARTMAYTLADAAARSGASGVASTRPAADNGMTAKIRAVI